MAVITEKDRFETVKFRFSLWYLLLAVVLISGLNMLLFRGSDQTIPYSQFKQLIADGSIKEVRYTGDTLIGYSFRSQDLAGQQNLSQSLQTIFAGNQTDASAWKTVTDCRRSFVTPVDGEQ